MLYLGGGLTCLTQVADTDLHYVLSQAMKRLEEADSVKQFQLCPSRLPVASNECKLEHTKVAWASVDHRAVAAGFIHDGILNALDGSEDNELSRDVLPWWLEVDMPALRRQLVEEVDEASSRGEVSLWG